MYEFQLNAHVQSPEKAQFIISIRNIYALKKISKNYEQDRT